MRDGTQTNGSNLAVFHTHLGIGGVERVLVNLLSELAERGHDIDLLLTAKEGEFLTEVPDDVRVVTVEPATAPGIGIFASVLPLARYLRSRRPDTLFSLKPHTNLTALLARRFAGVPTRTVVSRHSMTSHQLEKLDSTRHEITIRLSKYLYPWADTIVAVSEGVMHDVSQTLGIPEETFSVIYNPVVTPELLRKSRETVHHPWFTQDSPPVVLSVGRLHPQKNYSLLIRSFATLRESQDARLLILGDGQARPELERLVEELGLEDDVALPGKTKNPYAYMRGASVLVVSSLTEALPSALIEAMACGCPVVSTKCSSGPVEILQGGRYGKLVPEADQTAMVDAIADTLQNPPPPSKLKERASDFSVETITDEYEQVLFPDRVEQYSRRESHETKSSNYQ